MIYNCLINNILILKYSQIYVENVNVGEVQTLANVYFLLLCFQYRILYLVFVFLIQMNFCDIPELCYD